MSRVYFQLFFVLFLSLLLASCGEKTPRITDESQIGDEFVINPPRGKQWEVYAEKYLWNRSQNRPYSSSIDKSTHCLRMNNYGCLKHTVRNPYRGTPNEDRFSGAHDGRHGNLRGHAVFEHPKWSIAASFHWFERSYKKLGLDTATKLAERYAPWCDTQGSTALKAESGGTRLWGRTCRDGDTAPASFTGPRCQKPASGRPQPGQCKACNCPSNYVLSWLKGTGLKPDDKLVLFDGRGKPTKLMQKILIGHTPWEIGYRPSEALVAEGAALFKPRYLR